MNCIHISLSPFFKKKFSEKNGDFVDKFYAGEKKKNFHQQHAQEKIKI